MIGPSLAIGAGVCAAMASVCAKMAMATDSAGDLCTSFLISLAVTDGQEDTLCSAMSSLLRLTSFGLIFLFNAAMWVLFSRSLQSCSSSIEATVMNTGANFFCTAFFGWLLFGEALNLAWCAGASLIIIGLTLIHNGTKLKEKHT